MPLDLLYTIFLDVAGPLPVLVPAQKKRRFPMKKTMAFALTACLLATLLAGCSQTPADSSTPETTSSAAESQPEETPHRKHP